MHAWDERIGPDSSLTNVDGGKKQLEKGAKQKSLIPLPLHNSRFIVELPPRGPEGPAVVDTDLHLWRSYRTIVKGDDARTEGKKIYAELPTCSKTSKHVRECLRERLREQERKELLLLEEQRQERARHLDRYDKLHAMEDRLARQRAAAKGFDGVSRPLTKAPPKLPVISEDAIRASMNASPVMGRCGGKRMIAEHPSRAASSTPFAMSSNGLLDRWYDKSM
jgi:hypothetical protein